MPKVLVFGNEFGVSKLGCFVVTECCSEWRRRRRDGGAVATVARRVLVRNILNPFDRDGVSYGGSWSK